MAGPRVRAFSLIETVVVVALIGIASGAVVYWASRPGRVDQDIAAKASLTTVYDAQVSARVTGSSLLDAAALQTADPSRVYTSGESTGPDSVSVGVSGSMVHAAARNGSDCWALRLETRPTASSPNRVVWFVVQSAASCSAASASTLPLPTDGTGTSLENPSLVVPS